VVDALRPFGVTDVQMPCTPERVWRAIAQGAEKSGRAAAGTVAYGGASTSSSDGSSTSNSTDGDQL